jgi:hypothetical protein
MNIQVAATAIGNNSIRPDSARVGGGRSNGPNRTAAAVSAEFAQNLPIPARGSALAEVRLAIAANFSDEAKPARNLPRGTLVDLVI